ncbi:MAG: hypothetical protein ABI331_07740 [Gemmatimonadaceae bacterium]
MSIHHAAGESSASGAYAMPGMPAQHGHGTPGCECLGAMCGTAPIAIAQSVAQPLAEIAIASIEMPAIASTSPAPKVAPPHTLPFATAPPTGLLA